ncbi:MAG TPA: C13 family peptidase [Stellaceae bacterium]|nr:C13 family peptidase [Stellaceae bacterium]
MGRWQNWLWGFGLSLLAACAGAAPDPAPPAAAGDAPDPPSALTTVAAPTPAKPAAGQPAGWKAILIAGDNQEPAFDNAVDAMAQKLERFGVASSHITVLKASSYGPDGAVRANIRAAFDHLAPGPKDGCFFYMTSHGMAGRGLILRREQLVMSPQVLASALDAACGARPTVVIASGCFSGIYATSPQLARPNRVILTAARPDRPSFGCNASLRYTVFDRCVLDNLVNGIAWDAVMDHTRACVSGNEFDMHVKAPSEPQIAVGAAEGKLLTFAR